LRFEAFIEDAMKDLLAQMHRHVAYTSVGASTVRGQRTPGLVSELRDLLAKVDLAGLAQIEQSNFPKFLKAETNRIHQAMPAKSRHWGIARKVLNIFLRGATYNHYLRREFKLDRFERVLELPMDSLTAKGLKSLSPARSLPRWKGVKHLRETDNEEFQRRALKIAENRCTLRVHLDIYLWLER
jgi:hypothetical protein